MLKIDIFAVSEPPKLITKVHIWRRSRFSFRLCFFVNISPVNLCNLTILVCTTYARYIIQLKAWKFLFLPFHSVKAEFSLRNRCFLVKSNVYVFNTFTSFGRQFWDFQSEEMEKFSINLIILLCDCKNWNLKLQTAFVHQSTPVQKFFTLNYYEWFKIVICTAVDVDVIV